VKGLIAGCVFLWILSLAQAKESNSPKGEKEGYLKEMHRAQCAIAYCRPTYWALRLLNKMKAFAILMLSIKLHYYECGSKK